MRTTALERELARRNPIPAGTAAMDGATAEQIFRSVIARPYDTPTTGAGRRLPSRRYVAAAATACIAAVTALVLTTSGTPGHRVPAAVAALARDLDANGAIVHTIVTGDDVEGAPGAVRETWTSVDGSLMRYRTTQPDGSYIDALYEARDGRDRLTLYRSSDNTVYRYPWETTSGPGTTTLTITNIRDYADAVADGTASIAGQTVVDGVPAYRVIRNPPGEHGPVWIVAKNPDAPRLLRIDRFCDAPGRRCSSERFLRYDVTDDPAALAMPTHPGAKTDDVTRRPATDH